MTNELEEILEELKKPTINISQLSKEIDISQDKMYSWIAGKTKPKAQDFLKLQKWYSLIPNPTLDFIGGPNAAKQFYEIQALTKRISELEAYIVQLNKDKYNLEAIVEELRLSNADLRDQLASIKLESAPNDCFQTLISTANAAEQRHLTASSRNRAVQEVLLEYLATVNKTSYQDVYATVRNKEAEYLKSGL